MKGRLRNTIGVIAVIALLVAIVYSLIVMFGTNLIFIGNNKNSLSFRCVADRRSAWNSTIIYHTLLIRT